MAAEEVKPQASVDTAKEVDKKPADTLVVPVPTAEQEDKSNETLDGPLKDLPKVGEVHHSVLKTEVEKKIKEIGEKTGLKKDTEEKLLGKVTDLAKETNNDKLTEAYNAISKSIQEDQEYVLATGTPEAQQKALVSLLGEGKELKIDDADISKILGGEDELEPRALASVKAMLKLVKDNYSTAVYLKVKGDNLVAIDKRGNEIKEPFLTVAEAQEKFCGDFLAKGMEHDKAMDAKLKENPAASLVGGLIGMENLKALVESKGILGMFLRALFNVSKVVPESPALPENIQKELIKKFNLKNAIEPEAKMDKKNPPFPDNESRTRFEGFDKSVQAIFLDCQARFNLGKSPAMQMEVLSGNDMRIKAPSNEAATAMLLFYQKEALTNVIQEKAKGAIKGAVAEKFANLDLSKFGFGDNGGIRSNQFPGAQKDWPALVQARYDGDGVIVHWMTADELKKAIANIGEKGGDQEIIDALDGGDLKPLLAAHKSPESIFVEQGKDGKKTPDATRVQAFALAKIADMFEVSATDITDIKVSDENNSFKIKGKEVSLTTEGKLKDGEKEYNNVDELKKAIKESVESSIK